ncbi:aspartate--tRNA ligase [Dehalogenimonas alkenigignens]|uniref:Aspartate--tRNA(Asp/Asn) ligase n=1 Tax=Dehalogenimonas alkenigignens TaxID=1217799 RepID=A0A0W0GJ07_9CHLR|nr:aspartate--tRNA ligase [Dehalogenimonas alkenigignens]KTB48551.1 aspartyl-tRNA synthase [Dehalogenimonas alkenigignens]PVV85005.1 aspartate--tRNA ligase [Dehalogenimonas alkenigignens]
MLKDRNCGEIDEKLIGQSVTLAGWVHRRRDHGNLIFIDLRDRTGLVQCVFNPEQDSETHHLAESLRIEYVIQVSGRISPRPQGTENRKLATGAVEILVESLVILNESKTPPFYVNEDVDVDESLRLKFRYLDLRRERMRNNIILRHNVVTFIRQYLNERGFLEIETPILLKSTPEGARDYLVPSRLYPGKFYALAQSPQQLKQLLMVAGVERYYQIARCFRDEDLRADRQMEFTQLDLEMSFVDEDDMMTLLEGLFSSLVENVAPERRFNQPFPRLRYADIMERYGCDKPDLRFGMEIADLSDIVAQSLFGVFSGTIAKGGVVKAIGVPGCGKYTKSQIEELIETAKKNGAGGLVPISLGNEAGVLANLTMEHVKSVAAKYLTLDQIQAIASRCEAQPGDLILIAAGDRNRVNAALGTLRTELGGRLGLADPNALAFAFVTDFPLFTWNQEDERWQPTHHPFTSPWEQDLPLLEAEPGKVRGRHYDLVLNGYEIAGGSIRIHKTELQRKVFQILGHTEERIQALFGQLLDAFEYGAPPHGGVAPGIDRVVAILAGEPTIREVIPFPKNQAGLDLLFGSPSEVSQAQIDAVHISVKTDQ